MISYIDITNEKELINGLLNIGKKKGYTDQQMADLIGCSRQTYAKVRSGKMKPGSAFLWNALQYLLTLVNEADIPGRGQVSSTGERSAVIPRKTGETDINLTLNVDGTGKYEISTGISMFDHLLSHLAKHGAFDIKLLATGDDPHHLVEDVAICLGQAFGKALGDKKGIVRIADATVPMDETLVTVALDISGRGYTILDLPFSGNDMPGFPADLVRHFLESFAAEARLNLHARIVYGNNDHHKAEALFKALGRALDTATRVDKRISDELPSTKGYLEG